jgi:hypothetical protein
VKEEGEFFLVLEVYNLVMGSNDKTKEFYTEPVLELVTNSEVTEKIQISR